MRASAPLPMAGGGRSKGGAMNLTLPEADPVPLTPEQAEAGRQAGSFFSSAQTEFTLVIMLFGIITFVIFLLLARTERATPQVMRFYVVIVLVVGTLLVVSSSFSTRQIAPVVGFFGTVAGYLLGRSDKKDDDS